MAQPNPIIHEQHPLAGVFDALATVGEHLVTRGARERERMQAIARDPEQSSVLAARTRQAFTQGQSLEEIAQAFGFTDESAPEFLRQIAEANPQSSAERAEEIRMLRDVPGQEADLAGLERANLTATERARQELGIPEREEALRSQEIDAESTAQVNLLFYQNRVAELGLSAEQANTEYKVLQSQGRSADEAVEAWNRYDAAIERYRNSDNPLLRDIADKAGIGLTEPQLLTRLAHLENLDWQARLQATAAGGGADMFKLVDMQFTIMDRQTELQEEWERIQTLGGREKKAALESWELQAAELMTTMQILRRANPFFESVFAGALGSRDDQEGVIPFGGKGKALYNELHAGTVTPELARETIELMQQEGDNENDIQSMEMWLSIYENDVATILPDWLQSWITAGEARYNERIRELGGAPGGIGAGGGGGGAGDASLAPGTVNALDWVLSLHEGEAERARREVEEGRFRPRVRRERERRLAGTTAGTDTLTAFGGGGGPPETNIPQPARIEPKREGRPPMMEQITRNRGPRVNLPGLPIGENPALIQELPDDVLDFAYENNSISWGQYRAEAIRRGRKL